MIKQKVYDIAGTNCESLGSDLEWSIKETSAQHEQQWHGVGQAPGLRIWRMEKFHVVPWPESQYGTFYSGDSYIILHTFLEEDELKYDLHFWLGQNTTPDEAGTAAYKTVELDTFLEDKPVQHREVEGYESKQFMSMFPKGVFTLAGGVESGFFHVVPENYPPRLLKVKGKYKHLHVRQVPLGFASLNDGDVFILDLGHKIFQFNGGESQGFEKHRAAEVVAHLKDTRGFHIDLVVIDNDSPLDSEPEFWNLMGGKGQISPPEDDEHSSKKSDLKLFRLSDRTGALNFEFVAEGSAINVDMFDSNDVFLLDEGYIVYVWVGSGASREEKKSGMRYAQKYIADNHDNFPLPVSILPEQRDRRRLLKLLEGN
jgi:gelsolin